jgi:hypothetical protein
MGSRSDGRMGEYGGRASIRVGSGTTIGNTRKRRASEDWLGGMGCEGRWAL